jgi:quercetin dioxygenase-like cupin family protein
MLRSFCAVLSAALVASACSPTPRVDADEGGMSNADEALLEEVTRRVPQFDNEHVEVWKSIILPNQPLTMHRHDHPRALIALKGGTLTVVTDQGRTYDMTWETGSAYWLDADPPGEMHGDVNDGPEPVEVIVVQLKNVGADAN